MFGVEIKLFVKSKLNNTETVKKVEDFFNIEFDYYIKLADEHGVIMDTAAIASHGISQQDECWGI